MNFQTTYHFSSNLPVACSKEGNRVGTVRKTGASDIRPDTLANIASIVLTKAWSERLFKMLRRLD